MIAIDPGRILHREGIELILIPPATLAYLFVMEGRFVFLMLSIVFLILPAMEAIDATEEEGTIFSDRGKWLKEQLWEMWILSVFVTAFLSLAFLLETHDIILTGLFLTNMLFLIIILLGVFSKFIVKEDVLDDSD